MNDELISRNESREQELLDNSDIPSLQPNAPRDSRTIDTEARVVRDTVIRNDRTSDPNAPALRDTRDRVDDPDVRAIDRDTRVHDTVARASGDVASTVAPTPVVAQTSGTAAKMARAHEQEPMAALFSGSESQALRSRWEALQVSFVDEPRNAVEQADKLVNETVEALSKGFSSERQKLEQQWHQGADVSTEDLRQALRKYRSFFERLLSI